MKEGDILKKKKEYIIERFTTRQGLVYFFIGTATWYWIMVNYLNTIHSKVFSYISTQIQISYIAEYLTFIVLSIIFNVIGYVLAFVIINIYSRILGK